MSEKRIMIAEDDGDINNLLCSILKKKQYQVVQAFSGTEADLRTDREQFDLMIMDLMMPGMDGLTLLKKLRGEKGLKMPILVLSAKSALMDKVELMTAGADDYMTKPFEPEELLVRVMALLRRSEGGGTLGREQDSQVLNYKKLTLVSDARRVTVDGTELDLTPFEYDILQLLMQHPDKVFSRESLYEQVWEGGYYGEDNTVNVHVSNLRKKLAAADPEEEYIKTVWGIGFKLA
ncbi:MAG: response regulator transcription factor [Lachnospiraceae bacterium]|nr:response regulator transcription factor [Lachnospiraceae bacterium]